MTNKADEIKTEIADFLAARLDEASDEKRAEVSHWATYAKRQMTSLQDGLRLGEIGPDQFERSLNDLADQVIGNVGAATWDAKMKAMVKASGIPADDYARRLYRGRK